MCPRADLFPLGSLGSFHSFRAAKLMKKNENKITFYKHVLASNSDALFAQNDLLNETCFDGNVCKAGSTFARPPSRRLPGNADRRRRRARKGSRCPSKARAPVRPCLALLVAGDKIDASQPRGRAHQLLLGHADIEKLTSSEQNK